MLLLSSCLVRKCYKLFCGREGMDVSIIIPALNEEKVIRSTIMAYLQFFRQSGKSFEVIVVPNNCSDTTVKIVEGLAVLHRELLVKNIPFKVGKGGAIIEGFRLAKGDVIVYVDADNATKPETVFAIVQQAVHADCVMGSRWMQGARVTRAQPVFRRLASRGLNILVRVLLGLDFSDTQAGAKVFKRSALQKILPELKNHGWAFDVGVLYLLKLRGFIIKEVPITWEDNPDSHLDMRRAIPRMFISLLKIRLRL